LRLVGVRRGDNTDLGMTIFSFFIKQAVNAAAALLTSHLKQSPAFRRFVIKTNDAVNERIKMWAQYRQVRTKNQRTDHIPKRDNAEGNTHTGHKQANSPTNESQTLPLQTSRTPWIKAYYQTKRYRWLMWKNERFGNQKKK